MCSTRAQCAAIHAKISSIEFTDLISFSCGGYWSPSSVSSFTTSAPLPSLLQRPTRPCCRFPSSTSSLPFCTWCLSTPDQLPS
ncbi:hypothetical protein CH063_16163 [Colletotrichum higginsianum]|uniref:Uncharacterized protein n=1 Tax=Colletotrichum higginsianum (strain IMI 349063) TaxID=759273 RepID=H1UV74_COLHI|nr:hypothetical protein CH063_16163 [Colletotrichum higginsianum]